MTRRTLAFILALGLALSLTVIALAAEPEKEAPALLADMAADEITDMTADEIAGEPEPKQAVDALSQVSQQFQQLNRDLNLTVRQTRNSTLAAATAKSVLLGQYGGVKTTCSATLYDAAGEDAKQLRTIPAGKVGKLHSSGNGWHKVSFDTCSGYMKVNQCQAVRYSDYANTTASSLVIDDLLAYAHTYLGTPYIYGGSSYRGTDCSGFTMQVFGHFGYKMAHGVRSQYYMSRRVTDGERRPGDLVFFYDARYDDGTSPFTHIGIYLGSGRFIHASSSKGVTISSLSESYYARTYRCAGRIIGK